MNRRRVHLNAASRERQARALAALACLAGVACQQLPPALPAMVPVGATTLPTTVDSALARAVLAGDGAAHAAVATATTQLAAAGPTRELLARLAREYSVDFAALMFARHVSAQTSNARLRERVRTLAAAGPSPTLHTVRMRVLLVPGWAWRSNPASGANLAEPMRALTAAGHAVTRVETIEDGAVEANAELVAAQIRRLAAAGESLIVVSASKSGAEVGHALGARLACADSAAVRAWINVSGVLQGTPLVDEQGPAGARLANTLSLWLSGLDSAGLTGLSAERGRARFESWRMPQHLLVINHVGVPLSGTVSSPARSRYVQLRAHGPNDGLTLLADAVWPAGLTLVEPGQDHFLSDIDIGRHAVALARFVEEELAARPRLVKCDDRAVNRE